jgi:hypothetical protein
MTLYRSYAAALSVKKSQEAARKAAEEMLKERAGLYLLSCIENNLREGCGPLNFDKPVFIGSAVTVTLSPKSHTLPADVLGWEWLAEHHPYIWTTVAYPMFGEYYDVYAMWKEEECK